jgi:hypothetical protein
MDSKTEVKESKTYYKNGQLYEHEFYNDKMDREGLSTVYYKTGQIMVQSWFHQGMLDGICKLWSKPGKLMLREHYSKNERHGPSKVWYNSRALRSYRLYYNGKRLADLTLKIVMSLLHFKNRLRIRVRQRIVEQLNNPSNFKLPLIPSHIVAGYCI